MKLAIVTLFVFALAGCTARPPLPKSIDSNSIKNGSSLIVGSLSRANGMRSFDRWTIYFRDVGGVNINKISGKADRAVPFGRYDFDFSEKLFSGNLFAFLVPAGDYEIYRTEMGINQGAAYTNWSSEEEFSIKFHAESGEITYIGEYAVEPVSGNSAFFGLPITASGIWWIDNKSIRDIELLEKKYPNLNWDNVVKSVPNEVDTPIFILRSNLNQENDENDSTQ